MSYSLRLHPLIRKDYNEAYRWYEDQQKGLGERFIKATRQTIEQILLHPELYSSRNNKKFREAKVESFPYLVVNLFALTVAQCASNLASYQLSQVRLMKKYLKQKIKTGSL